MNGMWSGMLPPFAGPFVKVSLPNGFETIMPETQAQNMGWNTHAMPKFDNFGNVLSMPSGKSEQEQTPQVSDQGQADNKLKKQPQPPGKMKKDENSDHAVAQKMLELKDQANREQDMADSALPGDEGYVSNNDAELTLGHTPTAEDVADAIRLVIKEDSTRNFKVPLQLINEARSRNAEWLQHQDQMSMGNAISQMREATGAKVRETEWGDQQDLILNAMKVLDGPAAQSITRMKLGIGMDK